MAISAKVATAKTPASRARRKSAGGPAKKPTLAQVQKERDQLQAKLSVAEERVAELEQLLDTTLNRIDWAIDSLQTVAAEER